MKKSVLALLLAVLMTVSLLTVGAFADDKGSTPDNPFTSVSEYNNAVNGGDWDGKDIYLTINGATFDTQDSFNLRNVQKSTNPPKLHLTLTGCTFMGSTSGEAPISSITESGNPSFMYLSNCKSLVIDKCHFYTDGKGLRYGINWNLIQIKDATVSITNCDFHGEFFENAIKLNQRNGVGDTATDVQPSSGIFAASIANAMISNCTFDSEKAVILLGSAGKGDKGAAAPSTGEFPVTISNCTGGNGEPVNVFLAYNASNKQAAEALAAIQTGTIPDEIADLVVQLAPTDTASKTATGEFANEDAFVAEINGDKYTSLADAINTVRSTGGTITLLNDADLGTTGAPTYVITGDVTILGTNKVTVGVDRDRAFTIYGSLTLDGVEMVFNKVYATEGSDSSTAFCVENGSETVEPGSLKLINGARVEINGLSRGFVFESEPGKNAVKAKVIVENSSIIAENISANFSNGGIWSIENESDLSVSNVGYHGLSCDAVTVNGSTVDISDCGYRGISVNKGGEALELINGSVVNVTNCATESSYPIQLGTSNNTVSILVSADSKLNLSANGENGRLNTISMPGGGAVELDGKVNADIEYAYNDDYYFITVIATSGDYMVATVPVSEPYYTLPEAPTNSGYIFLGWRSGDNTYKAGEKVAITADTTFTAVWGNLPDVKPSEPDTPETPVFPFYDVTARDWYYDAVAYVYGKGLMDGVDVGVFAPNDTLTRAMVWTIIARAEGVDTTGGATWYAKAQEWVTAKGISDGENPNAAITRQELVTMLCRQAGQPAGSGNITAPDASSVSTWATNAMTWAMNIGLVEGDENGAVTPTATATRAQAAALIMRYLEA